MFSDQIMLLPILLVLKIRCYYLLFHFCLKGHSQVYNVVDINFGERKEYLLRICYLSSMCISGDVFFLLIMLAIN